MFIEFVWADLTLRARVEFEPVAEDSPDDGLRILDLTCDGTDASFLLKSGHFRSIEREAYVAAWMEDIRRMQEAA